MPAESLTSTTRGVFTPWKSANATNQVFFFFSFLRAVYQHTTGSFSFIPFPLRLWHVLRKWENNWAGIVLSRYLTLEYNSNPCMSPLNIQKIESNLVLIHSVCHTLQLPIRPQAGESCFKISLKWT